MKDMDETTSLIEIEIFCDISFRNLGLFQKAYTEKFLQKYGMKMRLLVLFLCKKVISLNLKQYPHNEIEFKEKKAENNFEICSEENIT